MKVKFTKRILYIFLLCFQLTGLKSQIADICGTPTPSVSLLDTIPVGHRASALTNATFNVFIHLIRKDDGTGAAGIDLTTALNALNTVTANFSMFSNICFNWKGYDFINKTDFYNFGGILSSCNNNSDFISLINTNISSDAIDLYFVPKIIHQCFLAASDGAPGRAIVVGIDGIIDGTSLTHEFGHVLGLLHTFETKFGVEAKDESNCGTAGDQVCDTPADPQSGFNHTACTYTAGGGFNPLTNNFMMQAKQSDCRSQFTQGQVNRIMEIIPNAPSLVPRLVPSDKYLNNINYPLAPFALSYKIAAKNNIYTSNITIASSTSVGLVAENQIQINKEFVASSGSFFEAKIGSSCPASFDFRKNNSSNGSGKNHDGTSEAGNVLSDKGSDNSSLKKGSFDINIMPNPGTGIYNIQVSNSSELTVEVYNAQGDLLKSKKLSEANRQIDIKEAASGIYTFLIRSENFVKALKVIKTDGY
jgi:hypothetical protein